MKLRFRFPHHARPPFVFLTALIVGGPSLGAQSAVVQLAQPSQQTPESSIVRLDAEPTSGSSIRIVMPFAAAKGKTLTLERYSVRAPGYRVFVETAGGELVEAPAPEPRTVRGSVEGLNESYAVGSLNNLGGFQGVIQLSPTGPTYDVRPADDTDPAHALHRVVEIGSSSVLEAPRNVSGFAAGTGSIKMLQLGLDADVEYFNLCGNSVPGTIADMEGAIAQVDQIYTNALDLRILVSGIIVRTSQPDPYTSNDLGVTLNEAQATWNAITNIPHDLAQLFTGKSFSSVVGISLQTGGPCTNTGSVSVVASKSPLFDNEAQRVKVHASQIGITLGAVLCNAGSPGCFGVMCNPFNSPPCADLTVFDDAALAAISATVSSAPCLDEGPPGSLNVYGCGANPSGSMTILSGAPAIGTTLTLGLDNPLGTQIPGFTLSFLYVAIAPDPGFPCGTLVPGFGLAGPAASGELLISLAAPTPVLPPIAGSSWTGPGSPSEVEFVIPSSVSLFGINLYAQGLMWDLFGANTFGLTDAAQLVIGAF